MRTPSLAAVVALVALASPIACTTVVMSGAPGPDPEPSPVAPHGTPATGGSLAAPSSPGRGVVANATVPSGVQCVVATVWGADSATVTAAVPAGASTVALNFGALGAGQISVSANAYNTACPGTGIASWYAEPVQATVVEGVATQIALVLRPNTQPTSGGATFSLPAIAIATGPRTSYAVLSDGTVRAWGANEAGEFGSTTLSGSLTPVPVPGVTNAVQIAAGTNYACVIRTDSSVMCWGYNAGSFETSSTTPVNVIAPPTVFPGLYAAQMSALGANMAFIGTGPSQAIGTIGGPELCFSGPCYPYVFWNPWGAGPGPSVAAGMALSTGNELCWVNEQGAAICSSANGTTPTAYAVAASKVFAGGEPSASFSCAIMDTGGVECWGANTYGELGIGSTTAASVAYTVPNLHGTTAMALSRGTLAAAHACAVQDGGAVYCAGSNSLGQLGNATGIASSTFTSVTNLPYPTTALAAGQSHTCALDVQGTVHCWGTNGDGQLGDGSLTNRFAPVAVQPW